MCMFDSLPIGLLERFTEMGRAGVSSLMYVQEWTRGRTG